MQVSILGPVEVVGDGAPVPVTGARVRRLLTRLALEAGRPVGPRALADAVWGGDGPAELTNALQSLVSRLRRALGDAGAVVATPAGGYRLGVDHDDVDAARFERDAQRAHTHLANDPGAAIALLDTALALWRGAPLADLDPDDGAAAVARLRALHRRAVVDRLDALVGTGRADEAHDELAALAAADPTDEHAAGLLMRALSGTGRDAEALAVFERVRVALADGLGADPSTALKQIHLSVLQSEPRPPARTTRSNLPAPMTRFVGRDDEVRQVIGAVRASRLVTLVGPGGSGKTRLAVESARAGGGEPVDAVWLVELAKVADPADVLTAVVDTLGALEVGLLDRRVGGGASTPRERLVEVLRATTVLLVLDNCEHVLGAAAELVDDLLRACPRLRVLATSREPLSLFGEQLQPVPPLAHDTTGLAVAELSRVPAVELFVDRVHAGQPDFALTADNADAVAQICRRLDGLPLALELAAARCRTMPVEQVAQRLGDRFRLLTGGSRTALPRHRTLRAVVQWSWGLLSDAERDVLERLAVFPGGVSVEAAASVVASTGRDPDDTDDLVAALVDKSLLQLQDGPRYRILETIREFGVQRLAERGALAQARAAHAAYFRDLAQLVEPAVRGREQLPWIRLAGAERDNFLTALAHLCDDGDADGAVTLAGNLAWLWTLRNEHAVAVTWLGRALDVPLGADGHPRDIAIGLLAINTAATSGTTAARRLLDEQGGRVLASPGADDPAQLNVVRAFLATFLGEHEQTMTLVQQAIDAGATGWEGATLLSLRAHAQENAGDLAGLRVTVGQAESALEQVGDRFGLATVLEASARLLSLDGRLGEAIERYEESGRLLAELGAEDDCGQSLLWIAQLRIRTGELPAAQEAISTARAGFERTGSWMGLIMSDLAAAAVARERGDVATASALALAGETRFRSGSVLRGPGQLLAICLVIRAHSEVAAGRTDAARTLLASARASALRSTDTQVVALVAVAFGVLALATDGPAAAAELLGVADAIRGTTDPTDLDVRRVEAAITAAGAAVVARRTTAAALDRGQAVALLERCPPAAGSDEPVPGESGAASVGP